MRISDNKRESPQRAANSFSAVATVTRDNLVRWSCHRHFRAGDKRNVTGDGQSRGEEHENLFHGRLLALLSLRRKQRAVCDQYHSMAKRRRNFRSELIIDEQARRTVALRDT